MNQFHRQLSGVYAMLAVALAAYVAVALCGT